MFVSYLCRNGKLDEIMQNEMLTYLNMIRVN